MKMFELDEPEKSLSETPHKNIVRAVHASKYRFPPTPLLIVTHDSYSTKYLSINSIISRFALEFNEAVVFRLCKIR